MTVEVMVRLHIVGDHASSLAAALGREQDPTQADLQRRRPYHLNRVQSSRRLEREAQRNVELM
jgi:hypothetical protein